MVLATAGSGACGRTGRRLGRLSRLAVAGLLGRLGRRRVRGFLRRAATQLAGGVRVDVVAGVLAKVEAHLALRLFAGEAALAGGPGGIKKRHALRQLLAALLRQLDRGLHWGVANLTREAIVLAWEDVKSLARLDAVENALQVRAAQGFLLQQGLGQLIQVVTVIAQDVIGLLVRALEQVAHLLINLGGNFIGVIDGAAATHLAEGIALLLAVLYGAQVWGEAVLGKHGTSDLGGVFNIGRRTGGRRTEDQLLGRAAEELVFGAPTTGASSDIENATKIARSMLTEYGFSPDLGTVKYGKEQGDPFSQMGGGGSIDYSDEVASKIDEQMRYLLERAHEQAYDILRNNRHYLDKLAESLLEKETLRRPDLERIFDGIEPREAFDVFPGEDDRFPRQIGYAPVKTPVELAKERGEELPKRMTLLDASRAARERRLAGEEPKGEVGFNFGQHAGDYVDPDTARELGSGPAKESADSTPAQPTQQSRDGQSAESSEPAARPAARPATGGGKHHKPDSGAEQYADTSQWFTPGWDEEDRRKNPYAREDDKQEDN